MMAKKGGSNHPILGYFGGIIFAVICVVIILVLSSFYLTDSNRHQTQTGRELEGAAVSSTEKMYNQNAGPLEKYAKARTDGDLQAEAPKIRQVQSTLSAKTKTPIGNVSLDDSGNGTYIKNGHKYLFQLADVNFVPHNSKFYQKNKIAIQTTIQDSINKGNHFFVTRGSDNKVNLYNGTHLVNDEFLRKGIAYMPNDATSARPAQDAMKASEHSAKVNNAGIWKMNNIISGDTYNQTYNLASEKEQSVPTISASAGQTGGQSIPQKIASWFDNH